MRIFAENAPKHWAAGLPVIPLRTRNKMPALNAWSKFCTTMPTAEEQEAWLKAYPDGNIGLPLGPQSGIVVIDLDSEDAKVREILERLMPPTPWTRVGKKGAVFAFRFNGERSFRIKDEDGNTLFEVLSRGTQMVVPPSIHPDTQRPYTANAELVDVLDKLNPLPANFEAEARKALVAAGFKLTTRGATKVTDWVPAGGRDSAMISIAGLQARAVMRGERSLLEALNEMEAWVATYTEKVVGDSMDPGKAREKVMEFVRRDIVEHKRGLPSGWDAGMSSEDVIKARDFFGYDAEAWDVHKVLEFLTVKFFEVPKTDMAGRLTVVEEALLRTAQARLPHTEQDQVIKFIKQGSDMSVTTLRKRLKELTSGEIIGDNHTEIAEHLLKELARYGEVRVDGADLYRWAGSHWEKLNESEVMRDLAQGYGNLPAARRHSDHKGIFQVMRNLPERGLTDEQIPGVNFANGFLTPDGDLLNHDPRFGATYCLPYRYLEDAPAPTEFLGLLDQAWGEDSDYGEKVLALREAIAVTLFKLGPKFSRAICLFGLARTGKSTIMDIVAGLVPEGSRCSVPPQDWSDKFLPAGMHNKLLNQCGELPEAGVIAGDRFKSIIDGEAINGQHKGKDIFKFRPVCTHWFATNHLPRSRDTSEGFTRRWLILRFDRQVPLNQKVIGLADQIVAGEREQIVAWAVRAMKDLLRRQEYTLPTSHLEYLGYMEKRINPLHAFIEQSELIERGPGLSIDAPRLSQLYIHYTRNNGLTGISMPTFMARMSDLLSQYHLKFDRRGPGGIYHGIGEKPPRLR